MRTRQLVAGGEQLVVGSDAVGEADPQRLVGVDHAAGEHQLGRDPGADDARQQEGDADVAPRQPDADERDVEFRARRTDADVAGERQRQAAARGGAVDGADDRLGEVAQRERQARDVLLAAKVRLHRSRARDRCVVGNVETAAEPRAIAGQDENAQLRRRDLRKCLVQLVDERPRQRVEALGAA
jgi:hypothetical protein